MVGLGGGGVRWWVLGGGGVRWYVKIHQLKEPLYPVCCQSSLRVRVVSGLS